VSISKNKSRIAGRCAVALLGLLCAGSLLRADSVKGRVLDPQGLAVPNARLSLFERNSGERFRGASDAEGAYAFAGLTAGDYLLEGEAPNAALTGSREVVIRGDETVDLALEISGADVEVIVTSSTTPLLLTEVAKAVDVVDSEEMALRDEFALGEALRAVPGVRVRQLGGPGSFTSLQTRGMRTSDTALLIDGLRFRDATGSQGDASAFFQDMTIVDTERIEFLRGSGSSLYGSHAMAGMINVNSSQGGGRTHGEILGEGGGLGFLRGLARVGGGLADDRFIYSGGFSHVNVMDGYRDRSPYRNTSVQGFAKYQFTPKVSLSGRLWGADAFTAVADSPAFPSEVTANFPATGTVPAIALPADQVARYEQGLPINAGNATFVPSPIDPDSRRVSSFAAGALILQHQLTPNNSYRVAYQAVDTGRSHQDGPGGFGEFNLFSADAKFDGRIDLLQVRTDHRVGANHLFTAGYEFEREEYYNFNTDGSPNAVTSEIAINQQNHALFAQDQMRYLDGQLHVSLSGRAQLFETGNPDFGGTSNPYDSVELETPPSSYTGDAAVAYFVRQSGTKLRAHAGNSYRAASAYERFGAYLSEFFNGFYGDPRLSSERSVSVDAGIDQWFADSSVRLSGTFFYTDLQESIVFDNSIDGAADPFQRFGGGYANGGGGASRGVELSGEVSPASSTRFRASYTYTNSESRTPRIGTDYFGIPGQSDHLFSLTATQWISQRFHVAFDMFAASEYSFSPFGAMDRRMIFDGPVKADVVFSYDLPLTDSQSVEIYGKVENVFDNQYYETGNGSPGAWAIGGMRFKF
jgi:iron complex outermembrane receptor protein